MLNVSQHGLDELPIKKHRAGDTAFYKRVEVIEYLENELNLAELLAEIG